LVDKNFTFLQIIKEYYNFNNGKSNVLKVVDTYLKNHNIRIIHDPKNTVGVEGVVFAA
jgi:hypothetical protein